MAPDFSDYGLWWLVAINSLIFIVFAFSFFRPATSRDWRSFGAFSAFLIALFTEMYGFPLTIYLLSGWLTSRFPGVDWYAHDSGHLLEMLFGWGGDPHLGPFHLLSAAFVFGGFILLAAAWHVLYRAQRARMAATTGPYALVRHPQYAAFVSIMLGFLLQCPTLLTLIMFPILVYMYVRLARREERESLSRFGEDYRDYLESTPAFVPRFQVALRLATVAVLGFGFIGVIAALQLPQGGAGMPHADPGPGQVEASRFMGEEIERVRVQVETTKDQMRTLYGAPDPISRRNLMLAHFDALRQINAAMHGMDRQMIDPIDKDKISGVSALKQQLRLGTEVMDMQLEMLEAHARAADQDRAEGRSDSAHRLK